MGKRNLGLRAWALVWAALWMALASAGAEAVHLRGSVVHVGFPGSISGDSLKGGHYYRIGEWTPVLVELTNDDSDRFEGRIEVRQQDRDGDEIVARRDVVVQGDRRFFLYVPGGRFVAPGQFSVWVFDAEGQYAELHDDAGQDVTELRAPPSLLPAPNEARVILDMSLRPVGQLASLTQVENLVRPILVTRCSPRDLPDDPAGLNMAEIVIWDGADPTEIDLPQRNALIQWVRLGGTLVLGVSRSWDRVAQSKLGEILPARLGGTATMPEAPEWLAALLGVDAFDTQGGRLEPALTYCPVTRQDLAMDASPMMTAQGSGGPATGLESHLLVTRRPVGRGEVILVAAELGDLLKHGRRNPSMLRDLLSVRVNPSEAQATSGMWISETDLSTPIQQMIGFGVTAGLYFLIAFVFVTVYILLATGGTWGWLRRKNLAQHTWNLFAVAAVAGSLLSVLAVQSIRGLTYKVEELSVVDGRAGADEAVVTSYLGLKSPTHSRVDLRLPASWTSPDEPSGTACRLRPLPIISDREGVYAASDQYEAVTSLSELRSVPLRATLKQFEGQWQGRLGGRLNASLRYLRAGSVELDPASWIQNDLGTDLYNGYLLVTAQPVEANRPHRGLSIEVYFIGDLDRGERVTWQDLNDRAEAVARARAGRDGTEAMIKASALKMQLSRLVGEDWLRSLVSRSQLQGAVDSPPPTRPLREKFAKALLLMTVFDEVDLGRLLQEGSDLQRTCGVRLDRSDELTPETALYVGFSEDPGPQRLCYRKADRAGGRWTALVPSEANVMYRMAVPVK